MTDGTDVEVHSLPSLQSSCQNSYFMSHFHEFFASYGAVANAWMIWCIRESPTNCEIDPFGNISVTGLRLILNDRSRIALYGQFLWGTIAMGEILSWGGGMILISFHLTSCA